MTDRHIATARAIASEYADVACMDECAQAIATALAGAKREGMRRELEQIKNRLDTRLNNVLCEMKPDYDDSITGFNEAWGIMSRTLNEAILAEAGGNDAG